MADENAVELIKRSSKRFSSREQLDTLRQEIALNFAPHLASWNDVLNLGDDFASHLVDGTPLLMARDFIGQIGAMLRPAGKQWFFHRTGDIETDEDPEIRDYLDWRSAQMMRIMTHWRTGFQRATKGLDEAFGLFGDGVISVDTDGPRANELRISHWHGSDCVWAVGDGNMVDTITRRERLPARVIKQRFWQKPLDKLHEKIEEACEKSPDQEFEIRQEVLPASEYDAYVKTRSLKRKDGWVAVWVDVANQSVIRETHWETFKYVVPRWVTISGMSYAISPATTIALPDARLIQQQALAILEAAEKSINPPLVAQADVVRGDVSLVGGDITWIDRSYDTRTGQAISALELGKNFGLGVDSLLRTEAQLRRAFFLDILRMPDTRQTKATLEVQFLIDEYIRAALPLFEPMQVEYNVPLLMEIDRQIEKAGGYDGRDVPEDLTEFMGDLPFSFAWNNPLSDMLERQKAQMVAEVSQLGQTVAALEAAAAQAQSLQQIDTSKMLRQGTIGLGGAGWLRDEDEAEELAQGNAEANQMREMVAAAPNIAQVVREGAQAAQIASDIPNPAEPGLPLLPAPV